MAESKFLDPNQLAKIYIWVALPAMILLCLLIAPFGSNDEKQHFLRVVSILEGHIVPETDVEQHTSRLDNRVAGGHVGTQVIYVAKEVDYGRASVDVKNKLSLNKLSLAMRRYDRGIKEFSEHSNTALYPPILYIAPIITVGLAKYLDFPILSWVYFGRLANAFLASGLCWFAIKRSIGISHILIMLSCLPVFLFQSASLSADAALLPMFLVFSSLNARLASGFALSKLDYIILILSTIAIGVGKVAYLPVSIIPTIIIWSRSDIPKRNLVLLFGVFLISVLGWAIWAYIVHDKVFSMRPDVIVNPKDQLIFISNNIPSAYHIFVDTIFNRLPSLLIDSVGRKLGYSTIKINTLFCYILLIALVIMGLIRTERIKPNITASVFVLLVTVLCCIITILLLYLQFNSVGATFISGIQGRYFAPPLVLFCLFLPNILLNSRFKIISILISILFSVICVFSTIGDVTYRYW